MSKCYCGRELINSFGFRACPTCGKIACECNCEVVEE